MKKRINVVGAVLVDGTKILAAQRGPQMSLPGMWEFPGGKIEGEETPQEALVRELLEELTCTIEVGQFIDTTEYEYDFGVVVLTTFYCKLVSGTVELTEHAEARWVDATELDSLNWTPADIPAVKKIMADLA